MAQELFGVPHAVGLYYTLTIELVWYVACAGLFALGWLSATERVAWAALAGLAIVGIGGPLLLDRHTPFATGFYLVTMLIGTALARHDEGTLAMPRVLALVAAAGVVAVVGSWANYLRVPGAIDPEGELGMSSTLLPWAVAYGLLFTAHALRHRGVPRWLARLGLVSYSVYLLHPLVLAVVLEAAAGPWVQFGAVLAGTVALSALTHRYVEIPGQDFGRRVRRQLVAA
jgi:peptidoglycan/LPS O-acetylase OafA/YrhL